MQCLHPFTIVNPSLKKFIKERVNDGFPVSWDDEEKFLSLTGQERLLQIPCGKCIYCFQRKQDQWRTRLHNERKFSFCSFFVTLTYSDENLPEGANVSKKDFQKFFKRFRAKLMIPCRYFAVSEYGPKGTRRPHYHFALFFKQYISLEEVDNSLLSAWKLGYVTVSELEDGRIDYLSTYCIKFFNSAPDGCLPNFMLCSRKPFIGADFLTDEMKKYLHSNKSNCVRLNGVPHVMPRIYREKVYDDNEKVDIRENIKKVVLRNLEVLTDFRSQFNSDHDYYEALRFKEKLDFQKALRKFRESKKL